MNLRPKDPARIRKDALRVAARKLSGGCRPCADAYVDLARRNGAGEEEVRQIWTPSVKPIESSRTPGFFGASSNHPRRRTQAELKRDATSGSDYISFKKRLALAPALASGNPSSGASRIS